MLIDGSNGMKQTPNEDTSGAAVGAVDLCGHLMAFLEHAVILELKRATNRFISCSENSLKNPRAQNRQRAIRVSSIDRVEL